MVFITGDLVDAKVESITYKKDYPNSSKSLQFESEWTDYNSAILESSMNGLTFDLRGNHVS